MLWQVTRRLPKVLAGILSDQPAVVSGLASASWNLQLLWVCLSCRRKYIFSLTWKELQSFVTWQTHLTDLNVSLVLKCFLIHTSLESFQVLLLEHLFLYLLSQANNPDLSDICPPASLRNSMTVPTTAWVFFNNSSHLALVHFCFSSSSCLFCHTLLATSQVPTMILSTAALQVEIAGLKLKSTVCFGARLSPCQPLQRIDARISTETQALYSNSCGAVRTDAVVS